MHNTDLSNNNSNISLAPAWTLGPTSTAIITPLAILLNGYVLFIFFTNKSLHTPFNVYLGSLLFANLIYSILCNPLDVISGLYQTWPLSPTACDVYIYALIVLGAMTVNSHALITFNRLWAMTFPVSYRNQHNLRISFHTVSVLWIYVHFLGLPGVIRDSLYFRAPLKDNACSLNVELQLEWNIIMQFIGYDLPISSVIAVYPYLLIKHRFRRRIKYDRSLALSKKTAYRNRNENVSVNDKTTDNTDEERKRGRKERYRAFIVTSLLTLSILICWVPNATFFSINCFTTVDEPII
ncbi:5-hydroxytryptamine receptor 1D-like [Paramacrobiotus metropolitanus]|uniref:5-hydroxytryptamine receptor 1D-like n=1 Tax=Paramacrobiotus metropolitanus TaxID=2943436 RepID=UPI002445E549|nr:5-hydroxytryptamine receptor 1D-like [Paramacrobiotus metropolitanus]